ncbi:hypothetical protein TNIN_232881 [Trichonephila inaurata madagascariensis]|uniref:Uncharacterized protein n=1 Tax=Trichonephila inaurata madagascariensis TaxID=2747483 RepID=A0A8X6X9U4_9ARAC|nr:hypothetical protein TNIN_232881 [Trichonephila inaurata madagascariensis]
MTDLCCVLFWKSTVPFDTDFQEIFVIVLDFHIKLLKFWAPFGMKSACTNPSLSKDIVSMPFTADGVVPHFIQIGKAECFYPREPCFVSGEKL